MKFKNSVNGHEVTLSSPAFFYLLFGIFYLIYHGLWTHILIQIVATLIFLAGLGEPGFLFSIFLHIGYAFFITGIIKDKYLNKGWQEVDEWSQTTTVAEEQLSVKEPEFKICPFCAEEVKFKAVVCKHCGKDLPA